MGMMVVEGKKEEELKTSLDQDLREVQRFHG